MKKSFLTILLLPLCSWVSANNQPHVAFIDLSYVEADDDNQDGEQFRIQLPIKNGIFLNYDRISLEGETGDSGYTSKALGGGFFWSSSPGSSMYIGYSKVDVEFAVLDGEEEVTRYDLGWRKRVTQQFEINLEYNLTEFDNPDIDDSGYRVGFHYYATPTFALTLTADTWADQDRIFFGVRFTSGK